MSIITKIGSAVGYGDQIKKLTEALGECETIIIGAGAGLSTSAGYSYSGTRFKKYFSDFASEYGIRDIYSGGFHPFPDMETFWGWWCRHIWVNRYMKPPKPVYDELLDLVRGKDYFVLTTNVDHCFQRAGFDKNRMFYTQGDYGLWQCCVPCHDKTYDNEDTVRKMLESEGFVIGEDNELTLPEGVTSKMSVPSDLVPHCPVCGRRMTTNLRADNTFVEDEGWQEHAQLYSDFLHEHRDTKTLFLELGVGGNTPGIVKIPFIRMASEWPDATYACLNYGEAFAPEDIKEKSIVINVDIGEILERVKKVE